MTGLSGVITDIASLFTAMTGHVTTVLGLFTTQPVLFIPFGIFIIGAAIGLTKRLAHVG